MRTSWFAWVFSALVLGACIGSPVAAPVRAVVRYPVDTASLTGGARGVFEVAPDFGVAGIVLTVAAGSAEEPPGKEGLAHLVEHVVFRSRHEGLSFEHRLKALGTGNYNGTTGWDATRYYAFVPEKNLAGAMALFAEVAADPLAGVAEEDVAHERDIVNNERNSRVENGTPGEILGLLFSEVFPAGHPYAHPVIGTKDSVAHLTLDDVRAFVRDHYRAQAYVVATSSPTDLDSQMALAHDIAGWGADGPATRLDARAGEPPPPADRRVVTRELPVPSPELWVGWAIPPASSREADAALLVERMGDSGLFLHVDDHDRDIAYAQAGVELGVAGSLFYLRAVLNTGGDPAAAADSLVRTFLRGLSEAVYVDQSFEFYKRSAATYLLGREETMSVRLLNEARSMQWAGTPSFERERVERTVDLTANAVSGFYGRYLSRERAHVLFVRPQPAQEREAAAIRKAAGPPRSRHVDAPPVPSTAEVEKWMRVPWVSEAKRARLSNGLEVVVVPRPGSPFHSVLVAYRGGVGDEPVPGAAEASLWAKERTRMGAGAVGVEYRDRVQSDMTVDFLRSAGTNLALSLHELSRQNEFRVFWPPRQFSNRLSAFEREDADAPSVFIRRVRSAFFGAHPYGRSVTTADLRAVKPGDVYHFLDAIRRPDNAVAVVVGDVDPAIAPSLVAGELGRTASAAPSAPRPPPPSFEHVEAGAGQRVVVQDRRGATYATLDFLCALPAVDEATWPAASVLRSAFQGAFHDHLREWTEASYAVGAYLHVLRGGTAYVEVSADLDLGHLADGVRAVRQFLERPVEATLDDRRFQLARAGAATWYNFANDTTENLAFFIAHHWNLGWSLESIDRYPEALLAVQPANVLPLMRSCQANWVLGLMGDEAPIREALGGWSP